MSLAVKESPIEQGQDEEITYTLTTTPWGSSPTDVSLAAYDAMQSFKDVTSEVLSGSPSVAGDVITFPVVGSLSIRHVYVVEIQFTADGQVYETHVEIRCVR